MDSPPEPPVGEELRAALGSPARRSVPAPLLGAAEAAYRDTWRALTGSDMSTDLADACAGWLIRGDTHVEHARRGAGDYLAELTDKDWVWGTASARGRLVHRLAAVADLAKAHPRLANLAEVSTAMGREMLQRWPQVRPVPAARDNPVLNYVPGGLCAASVAGRPKE